MNEIAWAVEQVLDTIKELKIDEDTLTVFVSDHGPHVQLCEEGGDPGFFRGKLSCEVFAGVAKNIKFEHLKLKNIAININIICRSVIALWGI